MNPQTPNETQPPNSNPTLLRWYIDTRPLTSHTSSLPLLSTLQSSDQVRIQKFYHLKDKHMSLASNLLKYLFVHRTCRIPWNTISISRTPEPHQRPCFIPTPEQREQRPDLPAIEFNVSHQAGLVALVGTSVLATTTTTPTSSTSTTTTTTTTTAEETKLVPEVGVDITCVNERSKKKGNVPTRTDLNEYVDIFTEVFSTREVDAIKNLQGWSVRDGDGGGGGGGGGDADRLTVEYGYRLFYTYWALKEAYIKMTGEALLASWLRELEFMDVIAPAAVDEGNFGEPYKGVRTELYRRLVEDVRIEVAPLGKDYLIATAARGPGVGPSSTPASLADNADSWLPFQKLDIEKDIRPCAMGECDCLG